MSNQVEVVEEAYTILVQLGGRRFLAMTGSHRLLQAGRSAHNPNPWLRMDLAENQGQANRLKITYMPNDLYKMEFYHMRLAGADPIVTHEQTFEDVYYDSLQEIFTRVTGLLTSL